MNATNASKTWNEILDELNGKTYTLDGISGTIKVERTVDRWNCERTTIAHVPNARGKRTDAYLKIKVQLHDDWDTDLTHSERLGEIAADLGVCA